ADRLQPRARQPRAGADHTRAARHRGARAPQRSRTRAAQTQRGRRSAARDRGAVAGPDQQADASAHPCAQSRERSGAQGTRGAVDAALPDTAARITMKQSIAAKLAQLSRRLEEINRTLSSENVTSDLDNYR